VTETTAAGYHGEGEFDLHYQPGCPRCTEQRDRTRPEHGMSRVYAATPAPDTLPYRWYDAKTDQYVIAARDIDVVRDAFDDYRDAHNGWCARAIIAATREEMP